MNRRDALKVMGGVATIPVVGLTAGAVQNKSLPVAQYRREVGEDTWYKRTFDTRTPVTCQRIERVLDNADEIMGDNWKLVTDNGTHDAVGRKVNYLRRTGRAWINKEDAEYLLHDKTLTPIKVWGEVDVSEMMVMSVGAFNYQGVFTKTRTIGMTDKTQWAERKWVWDHRHALNRSDYDHQFDFYREDCEPERVGNVQQLYYKIVYDGYEGVGRTENIYSLCGPVEGGKWRTEWMEKENAFMVRMVERAKKTVTEGR